MVFFLWLLFFGLLGSGGGCVSGTTSGVGEGGACGDGEGIGEDICCCGWFWKTKPVGWF